MNCGVPEADKDPLADDEPVTVSSGQFDEDGNDVTPKPLVIGETVSKQGQRNNIFGGPESSGAATVSKKDKQKPKEINKSGQGHVDREES